MIQLRPRHSIIAKPVENAADLAAEERALRRRLLFRMLKGYEFDGSTTECARNGAPHPVKPRHSAVDDFVFA